MSLWRRLKYLLPAQRRAEERDMQEELQSLASIAGPNELGNLTTAAENARAAWGWTWLERLVQDARYARRQLGRNPGFTLVVMLTLAIGIGANTAFFSLINAVLWTALPVKDPAQLRELSWLPSRPGPDGEIVPKNEFTYAAYETMHGQNESGAATSFADLACWKNLGPNFPVAVRELGRVDAQVVSGNYFSTLGVSPILGRVITPDDDRYNASERVVVISYRLWQRAYGGDRAALGRAVNIDGRQFQIVGVTPRDFFGLDASKVPEVFAPLRAARPPEWLIDDPAACNIVARLHAGVSGEAARAEAEVRLHQAAVNEQAEYWARVQGNLKDEDGPRRLMLSEVSGTGTLRPIRSYLLTLMAVSGVILLIACANIAGLLLARGRAREREIAIRLGLGASRARIIRQLATESLMLSALGGTLAIALLYPANPLLTQLLSHFVFNYLSAAPSLGVAPQIDLRVLGFTVALTFLTGLLFGLAPALRVARVDLVAATKPIAPGSERSHFGGAKALVAGQVALSLVLLIGAGLFLRTVSNLRAEPLGYDPQGLLMLRIEPKLSGYTPERRLDYFERAVRRLEITPGVTSASGSVIPPVGRVLGTLPACLSDESRQSGKAEGVAFNSVGPRFFETWRWPLRKGREILWSDREGQQRVALINEAFARKYFGDRDPIGRQLPGDCGENGPVSTVIGVVADAKNGPREETRPTMYLSYRQLPTGLWMTLIVRTSGDPASLVPAVRGALAELDPDVVLLEMVQPAQVQESWIARDRLMTGLLMVFGLIALLLSCLGLSGTLAYTVNRRTAEIGIRMAMGAQRSAVAGMVVRESLGPVMVGIALGAAAALSLARFVESMLFGVSKTDPWTLAGAALLFLAAAAIAAALPARRACGIDPMRALRHE